MDIHKQADMILREIRASGAPDFHPDRTEPGEWGLDDRIRHTMHALIRCPGCPSLFYKVEGNPIAGIPATVIQVVDLEGVLAAAVALEAKLSHIVAEA